MLLPFVLDVDRVVLDAPMVAGGLVVAYFLGRNLFPGFVVPGARLTGTVFTMPAFLIQPIMGFSIVSVLFARFGPHAINLAAITAGTCCGSQAHGDAAKRYIAGATS